MSLDSIARRTFKRGFAGSWRAAIGLLIVLILGSAPLFGQPPARPERAPGPGVLAPAVTPAEAGETPGPIVEQAPQTLYVPDEQGRPVPLLNIPLERIQRLLNQQDGLEPGPRPPAFQIDLVTIRGEVREVMAELEVDLQVTLLEPLDSRGTNWTSIPLRFHDASLLEPPTHEGEGQFHLVFDEQEGYQGWIQHAHPGQHRLRLRLGLPLTAVAEATQLRFFPPLANQSELSLGLSGEGVTATIENARNLQLEWTAAGKSKLTAQDLRNQVLVTWRQGEDLNEPRPTYLDVRGDIRVTIDGPGAIRSNVTLDLQSYGRPIEQFALVLPPNTKIVSGNQPGYSVSELTSTGPGQETPRTTAQIKLEKPGPQARIQLATQTIEQSESMAAVNVANFEVEGAIRQSGRVSLLTSEDWLVYWTLGPSVRRVQSVESVETTQERKVLASFQYFRQPCRLDVQIQPQGTRVGVEPQYRMRVGEDRVSLEAQLNYKIRGARISYLNFSLNGWQLDEIGPSGAVENDDLRAGGSDQIKLRLTKATSGDFPLTLRLHRPVTAQQGTLRFPLPWPTADAVSPGSLLVSSAESVVLNFRVPEMSGLVQDPLLAASANASPPTSSELVPAAFRFLSDRTLGEVVIDYEVRAQEVRVRSDTLIDLTSDTAEVSQRIAYRVRYVPASRITLDVPKPLFDLLINPRSRSRVDLRLEGESLGSEWSEASSDGWDEVRGVVPVVLALDRPRLGSFDLELRYPWPLRPGTPSDYTAIPLAVPQSSELVSNTATLSPVGPLRVEPAEDGNWIRDDSIVATNALQSIGLASSNGASRLRVRVSQLQEAASEETRTSATVVQRAWLQSWLSRDRRMDRAVFRIATGADRVQVKLPPGVEQLLALVDGAPVAAAHAGDEVVVPLPPQHRSDLTLELSLQYGQRPAVGDMEFPPPVLRDAVGPRRWFWQLLLPANEHLLIADPRLTSSNRWVRAGWLWRRQATQPQQSLEYWTEAAAQPPLPSGLNQYLFSSFDKVDQFSIRTCHRYTLVYLASSLTLGLGLGLMYVPQLRHPFLLFGFAIFLLSATWLYPDLSLLVSQAGLLGVVLILVAVFIATLMRQLTLRRSAMVAVGRRQADSRSGVQMPWRDGSGPHTTIAGPAPSAAMMPDSKA